MRKKKRVKENKKNKATSQYKSYYKRCWLTGNLLAWKFPRCTLSSFFVSMTTT